MTDRELLEAAAKAAGMTGYRYSAVFGMNKLLDPERPESSGTIGLGWNPLKDDGDALRLAVALHVDLSFFGSATIQARAGDGPIATEYVNLGGDPMAATRRAITRAAAALSGDAGGVR